MTKYNPEQKINELKDKCDGKACLIVLGTFFMIMFASRVVRAADCPSPGFALKANVFSSGSSNNLSSASYKSKTSVGLATIVGNGSTAPSGNKAEHGFWFIATSSFQGDNTDPSVIADVPNGGEIWSGTQNILWTATDAEQIEADALCATLYSGPSAVGSWTQIEGGLMCTSGVQASYPWNTTSVSNGNYWVRVVVSDGAGGSEEYVSDGSCIVDNTPPGNVTNLQTTSHPDAIAQWNDPQSSDNTVDVSWTAAVDSGAAGLDGYSILWDTSPTTLPDTTKDIEETSTSTTSLALANGTSHYFHIRSLDNAGNWATGAIHIGPFYIDSGHENSPSPSQEAP